MKRDHFDLFDLLRLVASVVVVYWHSYPLTGRAVPVIPIVWRSGATFATFGVGAFFTMSGFLIVSSWLRHPAVGTYVRNRVFRIFPGLVACVVIAVGVIGPLVTSTDLLRYFRHASTRQYVLHNVTLYEVRYTLPGVFHSNPYPDAVNGSLWTLPYELVAYTFVLLAGLIRFLRRSLATVALVGMIGLHWLAVDHDVIKRPSVAGITFYYLVHWGLFFAVGACCRFYVESIRSRRGFVACIGVVLMVSGVAVHRLLPMVLGFGVLVIVIGMLRSALARRLRRLGDPSYGTYIYAFPIQQLLAYSGWISAPLSMFAVAAPLAVGAGYLSLHLVERRMLEIAHGRDPVNLAPG